MPKSLRRFIQQHSLEWHLLCALALGFFLRALSAHFVYGPQALDDYKHGVWPAYQLFSGQTMDLPNYRSHFLVWILSGFLQIASVFGVSSAITQVRSIYLGLGVLSLLGVVGAYLYARNFSSKLFAALAIYLVALHGLMPFIGTRAFGEALALPFVLLGLGMLEDQRLNRRSALPVFAGFLILGVACCLRYHVGLIAICYGLILLGLRQWKMVAIGTLAGILTLAVQGGIDLLSGKAAFETFRVYMFENSGGAVKYGVSPWYNTWLFVLGLTLFPLSLVFWRSAGSVWRRHWPLIVPLLFFVGVHSLVPHKEERFLYPIVGLIWIVLAAFWAAASFRPWARRFYSWIFISTNIILLLVTCLVNTQEGEIEPAAFAEKKFGQVLYLDYASLFGRSKFLFYFLRPPSVLEKIDLSDMQISMVDASLQKHLDINAVMFMTSDILAVDRLRSLIGVKSVEAQCHELREAGSLMDRLIYFLNAKHNQRRRPTWYIVCSRSARGI